MPTNAGMSRIDLPGVTAFLWESLQGHVCLWESALSGGMQTIKCSTTDAARPKSGSKVVALHGPGALNAGARVVLLGDTGEKVVSAAYKGRELDWTFVRTLSPATSGRDVYYVTLEEFPLEGWLDLAVQADGQRKADRVSLAW
ncbi:hypothetical protein [Streptomyces sp. ISL-94]|uniref:hypothetical protein n=1 Tax=Streptomyces sp. ISL-94 TaxID=2819190 RepID=UPI001BE59A37|nr:hypothetical protein [Streptomyces sp. ISL-94]MBT2480488.1 hypothetical protein [Streptomyces sp. ISL-94]